MPLTRPRQWVRLIRSKDPWKDPLVIGRDISNLLLEVRRPQNSKSTVVTSWQNEALFVRRQTTMDSTSIGKAAGSTRQSVSCRACHGEADASAVKAVHCRHHRMCPSRMLPKEKGLFQTLVPEWITQRKKVKDSCAALTISNLATWHCINFVSQSL